MTSLTSPISLQLALLSAGLLGLRHGFDHDHIAAISDIASVQASPGKSMRTGMLYAVGHAITVAALGTAVILLQMTLPPTIDSWMERAVGCTLLVLGAYVLWTSIFGRHEHGPVVRSRFMLLAYGASWFWWRVRRAFNAEPIEPPKSLFADGIGTSPAIVLGVVHGLGAETPTQLLLFLLAANLGGIGKGMLGLGFFIAGLLIMNALICAAAAGLIRASSNRRRPMQWIAGVSGTYSIAVGAFFVTAPLLR
jgi:high-affinity nickel-transport protein